MLITHALNFCLVRQRNAFPAVGMMFLCYKCASLLRNCCWQLLLFLLKEIYVVVNFKLFCTFLLFPIILFFSFWASSLQFWTAKYLCDWKWGVPWAQIGDEYEQGESSAYLLLNCTELVSLHCWPKAVIDVSLKTGSVTKPVLSCFFLNVFFPLSTPLVKHTE